MRRLVLALGFLSTLGCTACDQEATEPVTLQVDHFRQACPEGQPGFCLRVLDEDGEPVGAVAEIAGLEPSWGSIYEVSALPAEDELLSSGVVLRHFDLIEVIDESNPEADARFEMTVTPAFVQRVDAYGFELLADTRARCETAEVCTALGDALYGGAPFTLELSHASGAAGAFVAHRVAVRRTDD